MGPCPCPTCTAAGAGVAGVPPVMEGGCGVAEAKVGGRQAAFLLGPRLEVGTLVEAGVRGI